VDLDVDIGSFRVVRRLALGERSEVLLARAHGPYGFQRTVVLKRLIAHAASEPLRLRGLAAEAIAYARLSHSAIVRLYDFVDLDGTPALVLEYVPGVSLDRLVRAQRERRAPFDADQVLYVGARVFAALAAAHGARHPETGEFSPVIHRDVSPGNVLVSTHGEVKLSDFGVARVAGVTDATPAGTLLGTYGYMAPEQIVGDSITVRADVYGAGLLLWELFAGRHAFERDSLPELEILQAMAKPSIPPIERLRPDLPRAVCEALGRAVRAEPDERISAREMLEVLRPFVRSAEARASLASDVGRARRMEVTLPDLPLAQPSSHLPLLAPPSGPPRTTDPDATSNQPITLVTDVPTPLPSATPTQRLAPQRVPIRVDTPPALILPTVPPDARPDPPSRRGTGAATIALAMVVLGAALLSPLLLVARGPLAPAAAGRPLHAVAEEPSMDRAQAAERDEASTPIESGTGLLETPAGMANHRVFVDGFVRGTGGDVLPLRCGRHQVQLGSSGRVQWITVPCGGRIRVER
jgi:serine/threonine protein kinase